MVKLTIKVNKVKSDDFYEVISLAQCFSDVQEYKKHYSIKVTEDEMILHRDRLIKILDRIPELHVPGWSHFPDYGTNEWADLMLDIYMKKHGKENISDR